MRSPGPCALQTARKPNSVLDDHSSRRPIAEPLQQPTRKFRLSLGLRPRNLFACAYRAGAPPSPEEERRMSLPIWSCSVWGLPCRAAYAVRGALLPHPFTLTFQQLALLTSAVCFLLHWPSCRLEAAVPDVIRHTALRSSDFPPPPDRSEATGGSDRPAACASSLPQVRGREGVSSPLPPSARVLGHLWWIQRLPRCFEARLRDFI